MAGFTTDTLDLLRDLAGASDRTTFARHRARYDTHWLAPARAFVETVGPLLTMLAPDLRAEPRVHGSILHPRRDVRFGRDGGLYRDHVGFVFWQGDRAEAASVLFLRVHPDHVTIGAGARSLAPHRLRAWRAAVVDPKVGAGLLGVVDGVERAGWPLQGATLATGPRTVTSDDPDRARLLRHTAVWVGRDLPHPGVLGSSRFASWCVRRWQQQWPLHDWLCTHLP